MALEITRMREDEIDDWNKVTWDAFAAAEDDLGTLLYSGRLTERTQAYVRKNTRDSLSDPSYSYVFVRDSSSKQVLAVACWYFQNKDLSMQEVVDKEEKARKAWAEQGPIPEINLGVISDFCEAPARSKQEILGGKAHALLKVLATRPAAQRKGGRCWVDLGLAAGGQVGFASLSLGFGHGQGTIC
ncbi:hypothetical protein KCU99_g2135, partial [Aureobasidium melanogenum]